MWKQEDKQEHQTLYLGLYVKQQNFLSFWFAQAILKLLDFLKYIIIIEIIKYYLYIPLGMEKL